MKDKIWQRIEKFQETFQDWKNKLIYPSTSRCYNPIREELIDFFIENVKAFMPLILLSVDFLRVTFSMVNFSPK
jgi:hypothetical protein